MGRPLNDISLIRQENLLDVEDHLAITYAFDYLRPFLRMDSWELIANVNTTAIILKTTQAGLILIFASRF